MSADLTPTLPTKTPGGYTVVGNLEELLAAVTTKLQTSTLIANRGIKVMPQHAGDLYNRLNEVINKKLGCLMMVALEGVDSKAQGMTPEFKNTGITVLCYESVLFNQSASGSKVSALTLAELSCKMLHAQDLSSTPGDLPQLFMTVENTIGVDGERSDLNAGRVCYYARFTTQACPKSSLLDEEPVDP